jgi:site-specific recombinase XerC
MASVETIEDPEDPRLRGYSEIRHAERRRISGTFIAEGRAVVRRLLGAQPHALRHAWGAELLLRTRNLRVVQE